MVVKYCLFTLDSKSNRKVIFLSEGKMTLQKRARHIIVLLITILLGISIYIIGTTPTSSGYEMYIQNAYPSLFWFSIITSVGCGIAFLVCEVFFGEEDHKNSWLYIFFLVVIANTIILLLPVFRGYALHGRGDVLTHLGILKDILWTGHISDNSKLYPVAYILATNFTLIFGIRPELALSITPAIFNIIYSFGIYCLARVISQNYRQVILITAFSQVLLFTYYQSMFLPTHFSFAMVPFILFLFFRKNKNCAQTFRIDILFVVMLLLIPFFHPLTSIQLCFTFLILGIIFYFLRNQVTIKPSRFLLPALLVFIAFTAWVLNQWFFQNTVQSLYNWFALEIGTPPVQNYQNAFAKANLDIVGFFNMLLESYGHQIIYVCLAFVGVIVIIREHFFSKKNVRNKEVIFACLFVVFCLEFPPFLIGALTLSNPLRIFEWALFAAIVFNGLFYQRFLYMQKGDSSHAYMKKRAGIVIISILLIACVPIGVFSLFNSPLGGEINQQVTKAELDGMEWFINHGVEKENIFSFSKQSLSRFADATVGREHSWDLIKTINNAPLHFGYKCEEWGVSSGYLVIMDYETKYYTAKWPEGGSFEKNDFFRLYNDSTKSLCFANGTMNVWRLAND
jgi:hypothetical protein